LALAKTNSDEVVPLDVFIKILKELKYNTAYYVDGNKNKTEL
jgi:hypothetical protein